MKKHCLLMLLFLFTVLYSGAQTWSKESIEKFYSDFIQQYGNAEMKHIFRQQKKYPYQQWVNSTKNHNAVLFSLATVLHEMQHGMDDFTENRTVKTHAYYLAHDCTVEVPLTGHFATDELNGFVPQKVADSMLRYNIYVGKKGTVSGYKKDFKINTGDNTSFSIYYGMYGLMEEFLAYYRGMQVFASMYPYFINYINTNDFTPEQKAEYLGDYKHYVLQEAGSYYEFQLYIGWYLMYARKQHPAIYDSLYANQQLRVVFSHVDQSFKTLLDTTLPRFDTIKMTAQMDFIHHLKLDGTEDDVCRFVLHSGMASEEDARALLKESVSGNGDTIYRFAGSKSDYQLFKKYYDQIKSEMNKNFKSVADAKLYLFVMNPENNLPFLKSHVTGTIMQELQKFSVNTNNTYCHK